MAVAWMGVGDLNVRVIMDRDSVHPGDDGSHVWDLHLEGHLTLGDLAERLPPPGFVRHPGTWVVYQVHGADNPFEGFSSGRAGTTTTAVAVIARRSGRLQYHLDPRTALSTMADGTGQVLIFCYACGNQDPAEAFAVTAAGGRPGDVKGELYRSMATLFWAAHDGARLPDRRDQERARQLGEQIDAMFKGGARARAGFRSYLRSRTDGPTALPVHTGQPESDRVLRRLATWAEDSRIDVFTTAYHASRILRDRVGRPHAALELENRTTAALNGDSRAWTRLAEHLDSLRGLAESQLPGLLDELTALVAARSDDAKAP
ncbi:hypothetical protein [Kitasatospora purpeofusca]|uniref:hypothetical protein n=1 Tax=Kitasatospora purpeofusca TaxID=67352 RepID=UPI0037FC8F63